MISIPAKAKATNEQRHNNSQSELTCQRPKQATQNIHPQLTGQDTTCHPLFATYHSPLATCRLPLACGGATCSTFNSTFAIAIDVRISGIQWQMLAAWCGVEGGKIGHIILRWQHCNRRWGKRGARDRRR